MAETGEGGSGTREPGTDDGKPAPKYTDADLDRIIAKKIGEERAKLERRYAGATEEREELERLRQERIDREQKDLESKGEFDRAKKAIEERNAKALKDRDDRNEKTLGELKAERIRRALVSSAARLNAIDPDEVAELLDRRCYLNEEFKAEAKDDDGAVLTPEQLVEAYLLKKPHLVKAGSTGEGGGSRGGATTTGARVGSAELQQALKALEEADKLAKATGMPHDLARVQEAHRKVKALQK
jgi:hypothetical protein